MLGADEIWARFGPPTSRLHESSALKKIINTSLQVQPTLGSEDLRGYVQDKQLKARWHVISYVDLGPVEASSLRSSSSKFTRCSKNCVQLSSQPSGGGTLQIACTSLRDAWFFRILWKTFQVLPGRYQPRLAAAWQGVH